MSIKEFFAFAVIKQKAIEYLKVKTDFEILPEKHKRPFRAHINKLEDDYYVCDNFH